jgi:hypothetical protein
MTDFKLSSMEVGMFFAIWPLFYIPASIAVQFIPVYAEKRAIIILSTMLSSIAFLFVGPSQLLGLPDNLLIMGVG